MTDSELLKTLERTIEQELRTKANEEIEKAKRRMENQLYHEKDIIVGKVMNSIAFMIKEREIGEDVQFTVIIHNEKRADNGR